MSTNVYRDTLQVVRESWLPGSPSRESSRLVTTGRTSNIKPVVQNSIIGTESLVTRIITDLGARTFADRVMISSVTTHVQQMVPWCACRAGEAITVIKVRTQKQSSNMYKNLPRIENSSNNYWINLIEWRHIKQPSACLWTIWEYVKNLSGFFKFSDKYKHDWPLFTSARDCL